ncbi:MAG TPA: NADPH-dependent glutamate synthase [Spirochaetales bacterium]|nr:NADPH-dependent glutamate synthase [Spirochaetales bacterium]HRY56339.1 NADPH-dependent glutamate synthase [Spirochaetia bacterium]HRZ64275.1 NADPH-dependent glutamate synthase [Spirochaetia bacterium]
MSDTKTPGALRDAAAALRRELEARPSLGPKERRAIPQQEMPAQDPRERRGNMEEVALGYSEDQAVVESLRCLGCASRPCVAGCPVSIDIPRFLAQAAKADFDGALATIRAASMLPAICGRVCPQEKQCMAACTVGRIEKDPEKSVAIGRVERFLADRTRSAADRTRSPAGSPRAASRPAPKAPPTGKRVAIVGSGPSGLTAAADLARAGHEVTVFEAFHKPGGVAVYGIPEFRLPKAIVEEEARSLEELGVRVVCDFLVGRTRTIRELMGEDGFDAVYVASGAGLPKFMGIPGEDLVGVFSANEYLTRSNLMKAYDRGRAATPLYAASRVAVFGGGNVAMDAARTALRAGAAEVRVIYRRTEAEMPARAEEIRHAKEEGVIFDFLANPLRILGDEEGRVRAVECLRYGLGEPDASGRARPVPLPGSEYLLEADACVVALGNESNPLVTATTPELAVNGRGNILVDGSGATSMPGVFAGGDIVQGAATVILAMGDGRRAARGIGAYLAREPS